MNLTRRGFLTTVGTLAAGSALPLPMISRLSPPALDALHEHSQSLARRLHVTPPLLVLGDARSQLQDVETLLLGAYGWQRPRLSRTAALTALVAVRASRLANTRHTGSLIDRAEQHARGANDGPLLAQALVYRARHTGEGNYAVDAGTTNGERTLVAALSLAGSPAILRAIIRYELAWEYAALGDTRGAQLELVGADIEQDRATSCPDVVELDTAVWKAGGGSFGYRGSVLRRLQLHDDAIAACTQALIGPPHWKAFSLIDIARCHAAKDDVDAAAAALEEACLVDISAGLAYRQGRVRAALALLPDTASVRQLDAVMHG